MSTCPFLAEDDGREATPVTPLRKGDLPDFLQREPRAAAWVRALRFEASPGTHCVIPGDDGAVGRVLLGIGETPMWDWASLPASIPADACRIDPSPSGASLGEAALGWALATWRFQRYRAKPSRFATLLWPRDADPAIVAGVQRTAEAMFLVRELINTPAADLGPSELAGAIAAVAARRGARCTMVTGEDLAREYPAVHAVGRGSPRSPVLADLVWGDETAPKVTLVGKGVCFDSGGLDIKPASAMKLMKKDMGGAAIMLGLADMIMARELPVRLRLIVPAVENSVSGEAMRPLDVVRSRLGPTIEIGNTDAEGRVILADALAEAAAERPELLLDCATLTGAARVALGTEIAALFCDEDGLAADLLTAGVAVGDPLWRLPLWPGYRRHIEGKTADLNNAPDLPFAGAITAALFLAEFVRPACPWAHLDLMAWNTESRPGRPEGGEAQGLRAMFSMLETRFGV